MGQTLTTVSTNLSSLCPATQTSSSPSPLAEQVAQYTNDEDNLTRQGERTRKKSGQLINMSEVTSSTTTVEIPIISSAMKLAELDVWVEKINSQFPSCEIYKNIKSLSAKNNYAVNLILYAALQCLSPSARYISTTNTVENEPATGSPERIALNRIAEKVVSLYEEKYVPKTWMRKVLRKSLDKPKYHVTKEKYFNENKDKINDYQKDRFQLKGKVLQKDRRRELVLNSKTGFQLILKITSYMAADNIQVETDEHDVGVRGGYTKEAIVSYCQNNSFQLQLEKCSDEDWENAKKSVHRDDARLILRNQLKTKWGEIKGRLDVRKADQDGANSAPSNVGDLIDSISILTRAIDLLDRTCMPCVGLKMLVKATAAAEELDVQQDYTILLREIRCMIRCLGKQTDLFPDQIDQTYKCIQGVRGCSTAIHGMLLIF